MVITVHCPSCAKTFPVDPLKIPEKGVKVRCSSCAEIFRVERPAEATPPPPAPPPPPPAPLPVAPQPVAEEEAGFAPPPAEAEVETEAGETFRAEVETEAEEASGAEAEAAAPEAPSDDDTSGVGAFTFGRRDPIDKARRLARVLVSDMIMYNPQRHEQALANGTLKEDFEEEIRKSWKEYVEQVGEEMANEHDFWADALNDVLAKGERVF